MKIALFTDSFLPGVGGTENAVFNYASALSKEHEVVVFAPKYTQEFCDTDKPFKIVRAKSIGVTKNDFFAMPYFTKEVKKTLLEFAPDIIHCNTVGQMTAYPLKFGKKHKIPVVCTLHTKFKYCYIHDLKSKFLANILLKFVMRRIKKADAVTAVSFDMKEEARSYGIKNDITVIKNGLNAPTGESLKKTPTKIFTFLYVGMISEFKNIAFSLRALAKVKEKNSQFIFNIVGRGSDVKKFQNLTKELGLEEQVNFVGVVKDKKVLNSYYSNADLFLFPSVFDNDALVLLEAGFQGTPSLVLRNTGSAERIVENESGFATENDLDAYANKILELMNDKSLLEKVGERAKSIYTPWEDTVIKYLDFYKQTIKNYK